MSTELSIIQAGVASAAASAGTASSGAALSTAKAAEAVAAKADAVAAKTDAEEAASTATSQAATATTEASEAAESAGVASAKATEAEASAVDAALSAGATSGAAASTDTVMAGRVNDPASATALALSATIAAELGDVADPESVATYLTEAAAEAAVDVEVTERELLSAPANEDGAFRIRDEGSHEAFAVRPTGKTVAHDLLFERMSSESGDARWTFKDQADHVALQFRDDGTVFIADPRFTNPINPAGTELRLADIAVAGTGVTRVRLVIGAGQSNDEGRQTPFHPRIDPVDPDVLMWDWASQTLKPATVPLSSQVSMTGKSPLSWIAAHHKAMVGRDTRVVILNISASSSGLVADSSTGNWGVGYAGANPHLYTIGTTEIGKTITAINAMYPGAVIEPWLYWHQGESDTADEATYGAALDQLATGFRTYLGDQTIPFVAAGVVPEYRAQNGVDRALINLPSRLEYTGYADGVPNGGGNLAGGALLSVVHYMREGGERLSRRMFEASLRACISNAASTPHKPLDVYATFINGTLTVDWSPPFSRVTAFVCEYSIDGGAWVAATRTVACDIHQIVTGLSGTMVQVRVSTVNGATTSATTTPVTALGV